MIKNIFCLALFFFSAFIISNNSVVSSHEGESNSANIWEVESIDTMKYSRDIAREKLHDSSFDQVIESQIASIAQTGATHVAIATPYDEEFIPFLTRWVKFARKYDLKVWFRGNFSGWEGWFDYESISREEHIEYTEKFILGNKSLFEDGDIFISCPECENGGPGDPRAKGDKEDYRSFLIDEYETTKKAFSKINKDVASNYFSMNGDVAKLIMDKETTASLDGIVVIDHYVATPEKMISDIRQLADASGGKIVLGEFGNPIPDIHGKQSEEQQAEWLDNVLFALAQEPTVVGLNYWTLTGGSTEIADGEKKRKSYEVLSRYFNVWTLTGHVTNELNQPVETAEIVYLGRVYHPGPDGDFSIPDILEEETIKVIADGYKSQKISLKDIEKDDLEVVLIKESENILFRFLKFISNLFR